MDITSSELSGFYKLPVKKRLKIVKKFSNLTKDDVKALRHCGALDLSTANNMIENVIGTMHLPLGIATNFLINGKDYLIPMALEEPSVVAAASHAAKLARPSGGFQAECDDPIMIGQIQVVKVKDIDASARRILQNKKRLKEIANMRNSTMFRLGGGLKDIEVRKIDSKIGKMLVVHLLVDVRDAMGANCVNTMAETLAPIIEELAGGHVRLRIISNLAVKRLARAKVVWKKEIIGKDVAEKVIEAHALAEADHFRCATHNKGIMNSIDAVLLSTGNDFRSVEAGAHAFASINGSYSPLTHYKKDPEGNLVGYIELPMAVGLFGGSTRVNPVAKVSLKILGVNSSGDLGGILACVGLASNFAALRALVTEGIQAGHMKLHAKNVAIAAGAKDREINVVARRLVKSELSLANAVRLLRELKKEKRGRMIKRVKMKIVEKENKLKRRFMKKYRNSE